MQPGLADIMRDDANFQNMMSCGEGVKTYAGTSDDEVQGASSDRAGRVIELISLPSALMFEGTKGDLVASVVSKITLAGRERYAADVTTGGWYRTLHSLVRVTRCFSVPAPATQSAANEAHIALGLAERREIECKRAADNAKKVASAAATRATVAVSELANAARAVKNARDAREVFNEFWVECESYKVGQGRFHEYYELLGNGVMSLVPARTIIRPEHVFASSRNMGLQPGTFLLNPFYLK